MTEAVVLQRRAQWNESGLAAPRRRPFRLVGGLRLDRVRAAARAVHAGRARAHGGARAPAAGETRSPRVRSPSGGDKKRRFSLTNILN